MVNLMNFDAETVTLFRNTGWLDKIGSIILTSTQDALHCGDLITLKATVTNLEDAPMPNILVKFIMGHNIVGYAATNNKGIATFYYRINNQGVYNFHAVVGKIGASTRIYIAERGNLLSFETMSGGDYGTPSEARGDYVRGAGVTLGTSMDWSSNGERSIKMIKSGSSGTNVRFPVSSVEAGKTLKITCDCYVTSATARIGIIQYDSNNQILATDVVFVSEGEFEMSKVLDNNIASAALYVMLNSSDLGDILYIDNISAILGDG